MVQRTPRRFPTMTVLENVALGLSLAGRPHIERKSRRSILPARRFRSSAWSTGARNRSRSQLHEQRFLELARRPVPEDPQLFVLDEVMAGLNDAEWRLLSR